MDRRWRNQRAAASMNAQQRDQQAAAAAAGTTTTATTANTTSTTITTGTTTTSGNIQQPTANSLASNSATINRGRSENQRAPTGVGLQLHNLRPSTSQLPTIGGNKQSVSATSSSQHNEPATEQSALDMAHSAAARVTGSAAAAIAAAKFKMLRSNTLAAAFGRPADTEQQTNNSAAECSVPTIDMMAIRTKDDRIINTLSTSVSGAGNKNRLNFDLPK